MTSLMDHAREPGKWRQLLAALILNLTALNVGLCYGWPSPTTPQLVKQTTPIGDRPMTTNEISWLTSAMHIGAFFVLPFCSTLSEYFGRKTTGCLIAIPASLSWILIIVASNFYYLLIARLLCGITMAVCYVVMPVYVSEIAGDSIRGQLGSYMNFSINIGVLGAYILGAALSIRMFAVCSLSVSIIFLLAFLFMPETPIYLIRKGMIQEATKSLMWLRSNDKAVVDYELQRLKVLAQEELRNKRSVSFKDLYRDRRTLRGFIISVALTSGEETSGMTVVLNYTATIFQLAGSSLDPNVAAIIFGAIQIFASWLSTLSMERAGRRALILSSCSGMAICHCILAVFLLFASRQYDVSSLAWLPVTVLSSFAVMYNVGIGAAAFVVSSEVFSPDISSFANSLSVTFFSLLGFGLTKLFPFGVDLMGLHNCFFIFVIFCLCTFTFAYLFVPETKGRPIESILDELNGSWLVKRKPKDIETE